MCYVYNPSIMLVGASAGVFALVAAAIAQTIIVGDQSHSHCKPWLIKNILQYRLQKYIITRITNFTLYCTWARLDWYSAAANQINHHIGKRLRYTIFCSKIIHLAYIYQTIYMLGKQTNQKFHKLADGRSSLNVVFHKSFARKKIV